MCTVRKAPRFKLRPRAAHDERNNLTDALCIILVVGKSFILNV